MANKKQIMANRRNAKKSTGPKTEAGRESSKMNAVKHGLTATQPVVLHEDTKQFERLREAVWDALQPVGVFEQDLVDRIISAMWRLRRVVAAETGLFEYQYFGEIARRAKREAESLVVEEPVLRENDWVDQTMVTVTDQEAHDNARTKQQWAEEECSQLDRSFSVTFLGDYGAGLDRIRRYETGVEKSLDKAFDKLAQMQAVRRGETIPVLSVTKLLALGAGGSNGKKQ